MEEDNGRFLVYREIFTIDIAYKYRTFFFKHQLLKGEREMRICCVLTDDNIISIDDNTIFELDSKQ